MSATSFEAGDLATLGVVFIQDRDGQALVRLPNGSKTTVDYGALRRVGGPVHFVRDPTGEGATAYCQSCDWEAHRATRAAAEDAFVQHVAVHRTDR